MSGTKKYIFTFKEGTGENSEEAKTAREFIKSQGKRGKVTHDYGEVGFAAEVPVSEAATASDLKSHKSMSAVEFVEEDGIMTTQ